MMLIFWYATGSLSILWFVFLQCNETQPSKFLLSAGVWMIFSVVQVAKYEIIEALKAVT